MALLPYVPGTSSHYATPGRTWQCRQGTVGWAFDREYLHWEKLGGFRELLNPTQISRWRLRRTSNPRPAASCRNCSWPWPRWGGPACRGGRGWERLGSIALVQLAREGFGGRHLVGLGWLSWRWKAILQRVLLREFLLGGPRELLWNHWLQPGGTGCPGEQGRGACPTMHVRRPPPPAPRASDLCVLLSSKPLLALGKESSVTREDMKCQVVTLWRLFTPLASGCWTHRKWARQQHILLSGAFGWWNPPQTFPWRLVNSLSARISPNLGIKLWGQSPSLNPYSFFVSFNHK